MPAASPIQGGQVPPWLRRAADHRRHSSSSGGGRAGVPLVRLSSSVAMAALCAWACQCRPAGTAETFVSPAAARGRWWQRPSGVPGPAAASAAEGLSGAGGPRGGAGHGALPGGSAGLVACAAAALLAAQASRWRSLRGQMGRGAAVAMAAGLGERRVVVTGMGITSCLGNTLDDVAESLREGKSGITFSQEYADLGIKSQVRGRPDLSAAEFKELIPRKSLRFMGLNAQFAFVALQRALEDAGLKPEDYEGNARCASILGQGGTSISDVTEAVGAVASQVKRWPTKVGPYRVTRTMGSTVSAVLSSAFKLQGPSFSISSACSTGAHCIGVAMEQIQLNKADLAVAGAGENECWEFTAMFDCMGALSTKRNDDPARASRAFDRDRDGFVIAGGGGMLVLEELEHARARGARIYAELVGYAANADGYDVVAPSGVGGERCMKLAMDMADQIGGERPVDYINTHGTSTPVGDVQELGAVKRLFEPLGYQPFVGSTKSLSGHALGAAGVHEAIYSLLMVDRGFLAESANIENLVEEADGLKMLTSRHDGGVTRVMSNSFGFGGTNACLVFDKWAE